MRAMNLVIHISIWILISVVIQCSILFYLDQFYLRPEKNFQVRKVVSKVPKNEKVTIVLPQDAQKVSTSFDGKYVSYFKKNNINIINIEDGKLKVVSADSGNMISTYKWLPDRHRLFIAERPISGTESDLVLNYYDYAKDIKNRIEKVTYRGSQSDIQDIEIAPVTNVIYMKVYRYDTRSDIFSSNAMNDIKKLKTATTNIGTMKTLTHKDRLIYEDKIRNKIYVSGENTLIKINGSDSLRLLGVDNGDNIYLGNMSNGGIDKMFFGSVEKNTEKQWTQINLADSYDINDIFVTSEGNIYLNNNAKGYVKNLKSDSITKYKGTFILMSDVGVFSNDNGKLQKNIYKAEK